MSRGLGALQRQIVEAVSVNDAPLSTGELRWRVASEQGKLTGEGIGDPFYKSFQRSLQVLCERRWLKAPKVKLKEMSEVVQLYPYCTRSIAVRDERLRLLPLLQEAAAGQAPHFSDAASEENVVSKVHLEAQRSGNRNSLVQAMTGWGRVEPLLLEALSNGAGEATELLIDVLARGRGLFNIFAGYSCHHTLRPSAAKLHQLACSPEHQHLETLSTKLNALLDIYIPVEQMRSAELKGSLYHFVDFERFTKPRMKQDAMKYLCSRPEADLAEPACGETPSERYTFVESKLIGRDVLVAQAIVERMPPAA